MTVLEALPRKRSFAGVALIPVRAAIGGPDRAAHDVKGGHPVGQSQWRLVLPADGRGLFVRQAAVVDIEVGIEDRVALSADEGRLRLNSLARLLLLRVSQ